MQSQKPGQSLQPSFPYWEMEKCTATAQFKASELRLGHFPEGETEAGPTIAPPSSSPEPQALQAGLFQQILQISGERQQPKCPHCPWRTGLQTPPTSAASLPEPVISAPTQGPLECFSYFPLDFNTSKSGKECCFPALLDCSDPPQRHITARELWLWDGVSWGTQWPWLRGEDAATISPCFPPARPREMTGIAGIFLQPQGFSASVQSSKATDRFFHCHGSSGWISGFSSSTVWGSMETPGPQGHTRVSKPVQPGLGHF